MLMIAASAANAAAHLVDARSKPLEAYACLYLLAIQVYKLMMHAAAT
jgi:hypothetical protein